MPPAMQYVLALDIGGTKCDALLAGEDGEALTWGHYDCFDPATGASNGGSGRDPGNIYEVLKTTLTGRHFKQLHFGSHLDTDHWKKLPNSHLANQRNSSINAITELLNSHADELISHPGSEQIPALVMNGEEHGIVILAGTGAAVYCMLENGKELRLDGIGPILGDYGSAYQIGRMALQAAAKNAWHPRHATTLANILPAVISKMYRKDNLVEFSLTTHERTEIASLARFVDREAEAGDAISRRIIEQAADSIVETVFDAVDQLKIADKSCLLAGMGSVAAKSRIYWNHVCRSVLAFAPNFRPALLSHPPVLGFALHALKAISQADPALLRERLIQSSEPLMRQWRHSAPLPDAKETH